MFALVRQDAKVGWVVLPPPRDLGPGEVRIAPRLVGICRTDLAVAMGRLPVEEPRILGHEFVGEVLQIGDKVTSCAVGDSVAVNPTIACGRCRFCTDGWEQACAARRFMGVDCDGALAESVVVPARNAWVMPIGMEDARAAMLGPVAACAAVLKAPIDPDDHGVISGSGPLAQLTRQVLATHGLVRLDRPEAGGRQQEPYDFAIDTEGTTESIESLLRVLRPGGTLVLSSPALGEISLTMREFLSKEPVIHLANYGSFVEARRLLVEEELDLGNLLGRCWAAEDFAQAFEAAASEDPCKHFLSLPSPSFTSRSTLEAHKLLARSF